ncbi:MAG: hypothetical protein HQK55_07415 [Deltaproteobacteria bacterium]|nr:hypothetical protein [Deltaproteobacteria bacterium]
MNRPKSSADCWDAGNGFKNIPWGTKLSEFEEAIPVDPYAKVKIYKKKNDFCSLDQWTIDQIYYGFCSERLCAVAMTYNERALGLKLQNIITSKYGPPTKIEPVGPNDKILIWRLDPLEITLELKAEGALKFRSFKKINPTK